MRKGQKMTIESREKLSKSQKGLFAGEKHPLWGKHHSEETRRKIGLAHKGKKDTEETRIKRSLSHMGLVSPNKGKTFSKEWKDKMSKSHKGINTWLKGKKHTEEHNKKISQAGLGRIHTEEAKRKMSEAQKGEKGSNWQGGLSFEFYPQEWSKTLKRSIRERDNYICQLCSAIQDDEAFAVHHIDYNKKNCNPDNLITLCRKCHMKTNYKRNEWMNYFNNKKQNYE